MKKNKISNEPLVSIVVRTKNGAGKIENALESLLEQEYPRLEVLVINDRSTDNTVGIVKGYIPKFRKKNIPLRIINNEGTGMSAGNNTAVRHSKGEILAILDDDSAAESNWITESVKEIKNGYGAVVCKYVYPNEYRGRLLDLFSEINHIIGPFIVRLALGKPGFSVGGGTSVLNKKMIEDVGLWDETLKKGVDLDYGQRFQRKGYKRKTIDVKVYHYHDKLGRFESSDLDKNKFQTSEYYFMSTLMKNTDIGSIKGVYIMGSYVLYRTIINFFLCFFTRSLGPINMIKGDFSAFKDWLKTDNEKK